MALTQPAVDVGRSPSWHEAQFVGVAPPARWNLPPVHVLLLAWQETQSPNATLAP